MSAPEVLAGQIAVDGVRVGCVTDARRATGVTVLVLPEGTQGAADIGGGGPATRETPVLDPQNVVDCVDAVVFSGGSAFGLAAADGVMSGLKQAGRGVAVGGVRVPIVVGASIFDLNVGSADPPDAADGRHAWTNAQEGLPVPEGSAGAGTGATVGKSLGMDAAMNGGQGAVTLRMADGLLVAALVVVNAVGSIRGQDGRLIAGPRIGGEPASTTDLWMEGPPNLDAGASTTLAAIVTNADLDKAQLKRVARMAHDGLAQAIEPVHTPWDGDVAFALGTGSMPADVGRVGAAAASAVALAVRRAVQKAAGSNP